MARSGRPCIPPGNYCAGCGRRNHSTSTLRDGALEADDQVLVRVNRHDHALPLNGRLSLANGHRRAGAFRAWGRGGPAGAAPTSRARYLRARRAPFEVEGLIPVEAHGRLDVSMVRPGRPRLVGALFTRGRFDLVVELALASKRNNPREGAVGVLQVLTQAEVEQGVPIPWAPCRLGHVNQSQLVSIPGGRRASDCIAHVEGLRSVADRSEDFQCAEP
jgi:hypothetical protein